MGSHPGSARAVLVVMLAVNLQRGRRAVMSVRQADGSGRAVARGEPRQVLAGRLALKGSGQWQCARGPRPDQGDRCSPDGAGRRNADLDADWSRAAADPACRVEPGCLDSDPAAPTTRQVHGCVTRAHPAVRLCSAAQASCSTCNTCIRCKPICVLSQASNRTLLTLLICSIFFSPVSPILANTPAPPSVLLSALISP
jgi:hypothetical protein